MLRWDLDFDEAETRYEPFNRLVDPDPKTRDEIAWLANGALGAGKPVFITVANNAEGCAPLSVQAIAETLGGA
jgi:hypothetical protein